MTVSVKQLRDLEAKATRAPWEAWSHPAQVEFGSPDERYAVPSPADAELIVAMRNALPLLLDAVEAAEWLIECHENGEAVGWGRARAALAALEGDEA